MAEIKLRRKIIYSGEVFASFMAKGWDCTELANVLRSCREVDAVEVVRCKDCIYNEKSSCMFSAFANPHYRPDYFCADGERREGE